MGKIVVMVVGGILGAIAGAGIAIIGTWLLALLSVATSPNDPSAGSVAIIIIFTLPVGAVVGAVGGAMLAARLVR